MLVLVIHAENVKLWAQKLPSTFGNDSIFSQTLLSLAFISCCVVYAFHLCFATKATILLHFHCMAERGLAYRKVSHEELLTDIMNLPTTF